jgi:hypothetical protein
MALPTSTDIKTMDYSFNGEPFMYVITRATPDPLSMDFSYDGEPFAFNPNGQGGAGTHMQVNIGDVWKTVTGLQINIGDSWKTVTRVQQNIGDVWKDVF